MNVLSGNEVVIITTKLEENCKLTTDFMFLSDIIFTRSTKYT